MINITNILNIKNSNIRIFPLQTRDHAFILFPDLMISYLFTLLIDRIWFNINQFSIDFVFPSKKYVRNLMKNILTYEEEYFIFFLENYYHSSDFAYNFLELILDRISILDKKPKIIIYSLKATSEDLLKLFTKYPFVQIAIMCDIEYFFNELFYKKTDINNIWNIIYRNDDLVVNSNLTWKIEYDLNDYILWAYHSKHYINFYKSKDYISSLIDEDNEYTNKHIYYQKPKNDFILWYRYQKENEVMLTTWRGCKYNCSYCYRWVKYSKLRQISLETIKKDLDYLRDNQYKYIYLYDDCFVTTNLDRMNDLTSLLSKYDFEYWISARYEVCTEENLEYLSRINIRRIQVWLQSVSFEVNKWTKRWFKKENFERTFKSMYEKGIAVSLDIILW